MAAEITCQERGMEVKRCVGARVGEENTTVRNPRTLPICIFWMGGRGLFTYLHGFCGRGH